MSFAVDTSMTTMHLCVLQVGKGPAHPVSNSRSAPRNRAAPVQVSGSGSRDHAPYDMCLKWSREFGRLEAALNHTQFPTKPYTHHHIYMYVYYSVFTGGKFEDEVDVHVCVQCVYWCVYVYIYIYIATAAVLWLASKHTCEHWAATWAVA